MIEREKLIDDLYDLELRCNICVEELADDILDDLDKAYLQGKADAIKPIIKIEEDAIKYGHTDAYELVQIRRYLEQLKERKNE